MPIDINAIIAETRGKNFELFEEHVNPVFVKVLRTLGFNRTWVRGEGPYLWDETVRVIWIFSPTGVFSISAAVIPLSAAHCSRCWTPIFPDGSVSSSAPRGRAGA